MEVNHNEEKAGTVGVCIAHQPTEIDVAHNVLNRLERHQLVRRIMHCKHDASDDLKNEEETGENAEVPHVVQIARHRISGANGVIYKAGKRKTLVHPLHETVLRFVLACPGKTHVKSL